MKRLKLDSYRRRMIGHLSESLLTRLRAAKHSVDKGPFPSRRHIYMSDTYAQERTNFERKQIRVGLGKVWPKTLPHPSKIKSVVVAGGSGKMAEGLINAGISTIYTDISRFWTTYNRKVRRIPVRKVNAYALPFRKLDVIFAFEPWPILSHKPLLLKEIFSKSKAFIVFENLHDRKSLTLLFELSTEVKGYALKVKTTKTKDLSITVFEPSEKTMERLKFDEVLLKIA